jgi:phage replication O-like protein O
MANPQKENGHIDIANEIAEALARWHLSSYEQRILWVVFRKTWGWHKKEDWISLSQFCVATGLARSHTCRALKMLVRQNIITKGGTTYSPLYRIQKDFDKWKALPKGARSHKSLPKGVISVTKGGNRVVPFGAHTKETITKETITIGSSGVPPLQIQSFINMFKPINPSYQRLFGNRTERACAARLILQHGYEKMEQTLMALPDILGQPYAPQISTPYELEKKLGKLLQFIQQEKNKIINKKPVVLI